MMLQELFSGRRIYFGGVLSQQEREIDHNCLIMDSLFIVDQYSRERSVKVQMDSQTHRMIRLGKNKMFISRFSVLTLTIPPHNFLFPHLKLYYKIGGKEGRKQHFLKQLDIRIPFVCPCPCGTPGMESVCTEHLGEQLLLEVSNKLLLLQNECRQQLP